MIRMALVTVIAASILTAVGCESSDDRVAKYAQWSVEQQSRQNQQQAQQNQSVVDTQRTLEQGIHEERTHLDQQHEELEQQRRDVDSQRLHEPLVAEAVESTGLLLACLMPLLVCVYALWQTGRRPANEDLGPLLVQEVTSGKSQLFQATMPMLTQTDGADAERYPD